MRIAIVTGDAGKEELLCCGVQDNAELVWLSSPALVPGAEAYIDLLFDNDPVRIEQWSKLTPAAVIVNSVVTPLSELTGEFIRINAWPGFLKRQITEMSCINDELKIKAHDILGIFNRGIEWVPDVPGFISARVVSMIINEAYFALEEKVSSKDQVDAAMKLGTSYPLGPFEWGMKISLKNIVDLLQKLSEKDARYMPAPLLQQEALFP